MLVEEVTHPVDVGDAQDLGRLDDAGEVGWVTWRCDLHGMKRLVSGRNQGVRGGVALAYLAVAVEGEVLEVLSRDVVDLLLHRVLHLWAAHNAAPQPSKSAYCFDEGADSFTRQCVLTRMTRCPRGVESSSHLHTYACTTLSICTWQTTCQLQPVRPRLAPTHATMRTHLDKRGLAMRDHLDLDHISVDAEQRRQCLGAHHVHVQVLMVHTGCEYETGSHSTGYTGADADAWMLSTGREFEPTCTTSTQVSVPGSLRFQSVGISAIMRSLPNNHHRQTEPSCSVRLKPLCPPLLIF